MKTVAIINQKGGVGKTTTTIAMASQLHRDGFKVLVIDFDPQGNLSTGCRADDAKLTVLELMEKKASPNQVIVKTKYFDVIPANQNLAAADVIYATDPKGDTKLKEAIKPMRNKYDFALIDCKPSFGMIPINAMMAADDIIIPIESGVFSIAGMDSMIETIEQVRKQGNQKLRLRGILVTRCSMFTNIAKEISGVAKKMSERYDTTVFKTAIRNTVDIPEAQKRGIDIGDYKPKSKAAKDYAEFTEEYLQLIGAKKPEE